MERTAGAPDLDARGRFAMVVQKAAQRMRESSAAEKVIAGLLSAFLAGLITIGGMVYHLNREVGESIILWQSHTTNHPNVELGRRIDRHEDQMHGTR